MTTMSSGAWRVTVAVPTYRRPEDLSELLPLLRAQAAEVSEAAGGRFAVQLLVVDNDPARSAADLVGAGPGVRYVVEPRPGIAAVRNRALDECAGSRLLVFIDDDERPHPHWLARLLGTWERTGASAVAGRVVSDFEGTLDPWIAAGAFFARRSLPNDSPIDVAATNNLLLDLERVGDLRFDSSLGTAGGEDTLFSRSLTRAGGLLVWCDDAVVTDRVPSSRMTRSWVLTRAWSSGNATVLTELRLARGVGERLRDRGRGAGRGLARVAGGAARWMIGVVVRSTRHRARGLRSLLRGAGMVAGAAGLVFHEYARPGERRLRRRS